MNKILLILGIIGVLFLGFIIFGIGVMGDRSCRVEIQNGGQGQFILKTFQITNYDKKVTVDSVVLGQNEKIEIGHCISCSIPDTSDIDFNAIGFYDNEGTFKLMNRKELVKYLETKDKQDCITYIVE
ncbi:MAG TPA: hypothetical protein VK658_01795 [Chryseolinea sp.]|nr:hypothetical protein [Chryseolinea sp.]